MPINKSSVVNNDEIVTVGDQEHYNEQIEEMSAVRFICKDRSPTLARVPDATMSNIFNYDGYEDWSRTETHSSVVVESDQI